MKHIIEAPDGSRHIIEGPDPVTVPPINVDPSAGMGPLDKLAVGAGAAVDRVLRGVAGLAPSADNFNSQGAEDAALYQKHHPGGWATAGEVGADVAMSALPVAKAGSVLTKTLSGLGRAAPLVGDVAANAGWSALTAPEDRGAAAAAGAGGAVAGRAIGRALTGVVRPSASGEALMEKGVRLTPGQAAGKGSVTNWLEQTALSNPISAYPVQAARGRALDDAGLQAVQAVRSNIGENIAKRKSVPDAIAETHDAISNVYSEVLPRLSLHGEHVRQMAKDLGAGTLENAHLMGDKPKQFLNNYIENRIGRLPTDEAGNIGGDALKQIDSELGYYARTLAKSPNATEKVAAPAWRDLQTKWRNTVMAASTDNADDILKLNQANAGWRELLAVEDAMRKSGGERLQSRPLAKALERAGIKTGPLADTTKNMQATFPNTVPDSGTALRLTANLLPAALVGGGGYGATSENPWLATAGLGALMAGAAGTKFGSRALTGQTAPQLAMVEALRKAPTVVKKPAWTPPKTREEIRQWLAQGGRAYATQGGQP